jgi:hypothetical protein
VDQIAEHGDRLTLMLVSSLPEGSDRLDHAVAVSPRPDLDYLHEPILPVAAEDLDLKLSLRCRGRRPLS